MKTITGETRYRRNWRGQMVLQVLSVTGPIIGEADIIEWRDATWEDVMEIELRRFFDEMQDLNLPKGPTE